MSNHPTIAALKERLESERDDLANNHAFSGKFSNNNDEAGNAFGSYKDGHKAATERLLPLIEKAVVMAEFVDLNTSLCPEHRRNQDIPFCSYNECDIKIKAREFLAEIEREMKDGK